LWAVKLSLMKNILNGTAPCVVLAITPIRRVLAMPFGGTVGRCLKRHPGVGRPAQNLNKVESVATAPIRLD
jgi:hypothetical protein